MNLDLNTLKEIKKLLKAEIKESENDIELAYNGGIEHCMNLIECICDEVTLK